MRNNYEDTIFDSSTDESPQSYEFQDKGGDLIRTGDTKLISSTDQIVRPNRKIGI